MKEKSPTAQIDALLRDNIKAMKPYSTARDDCKIRMDVYLDANENPYANGVNRYPSPHQSELKKMLSVLKKVPAENIFLGNGSDEPIDLMFRLFCPPGKSSMVQAVPTYGMYSVAAAINDVRVTDSPLGPDFSLDASSLLARIQPDTRLVFLCSPNNPSGNLLDRGQIMEILDRFDGVTVVDEAYVDFTGEESIVSLLDRYPRLVVLQTMSKAWGMAGLRIGMAIAHSHIIEMMSRVKYPYNISVLNQNRAVELLSDPLPAMDRVRMVVSERKRLAGALSSLPSVVRVYPSDSNFLLVRFVDKDEAFLRLMKERVIVRDRSSAYGCEGCLRITVGTPEENDRVISVLSGREFYSASGDGSAGRRASVFRRTGETAVSVRMDLDSFSKPAVATGLNFFNHMLEQIGYHSGISLDVICFGDLSVDDHHSVEDVAIAFGDCLRKALGNKAGIGRYGFSLPMDESEAAVLLDLGGRIDFRWNVNFRESRVGDVSSQMFEHFFKTLAEHMECNLHVTATGSNDHHLAEGIFKAFARSLKQAVKQDSVNVSVPSSKGVL